VSDRVVRRVVVALACATSALLLTIAWHSKPWMGATFPGFFVMDNRVVPSIALPEDWASGDPAVLFQREVVAVEGQDVRSGAAVYRVVRERPPGTLIHYLMRAPDGATDVVAVRSRVFSGGDYVLLFGAYLLNGVAFIATGLLVFRLKPQRPASLGLLSAGLLTGVFVATAADLYGPYWFFRLHVVCESLLPAGFLHLAMVFPTDRRRERRSPWIIGIYLPFLVLAAIYEIVLYRPAAYTTVHLTASALHGVAGAVSIGAVLYDLVTNRSVLVRRRIGVVAVGTFAGVLVPGLLMGVSALLGGKVSLNAGAFTAFLFPLSLGYAIVKQDLFEIDVLLRRTLTYSVLVALMAALYLAVLFTVGTFVSYRELVVHSPAVFALVNLGLLFLMAPVRRRVQDGVDRLFFRKGYAAEPAIAELSRALAWVRTIDDVVAATRRALEATLCPAHMSFVLGGDGGSLDLGPRIDAADDARPELDLSDADAARLEAGEILSRYEWDDGSGNPPPRVWSDLAADLLVPVRSGGDRTGVLVLGGKRSGYPYTMHDIAFLQTAASQVALAMTNAAAFDRLAELNLSLEGQVRERTAALENANRELNRSLEDLRSAYQKLETSQTSLIRADRLATLGRLAAGIAHEVNTPLAAVLNALKVLEDLGREYQDSIGDVLVGESDHREIAAEIVDSVGSATAWARKAAAYISKMKLHGREPSQTAPASFEIATVVAETRALLDYRLRGACGRIDFVDESVPVNLIGDPARLGQVLVNLVTNAIDAYEDSGTEDGRIEIRATRTDQRVVLTVQDWAGGMPPRVVERIFDELFTTKEPGRGTGLGLWIARNLVEQSFSGTLSVESTTGVGSTFVAVFPPPQSAAHAPAHASGLGAAADQAR